MPIPLICIIIGVLGFFVVISIGMWMDGYRDPGLPVCVSVLSIPLILLSCWICVSCQYEWKIKEESFHEITTVELENGSRQLFTYNGEIFNATEKFGRIVDPSKIMVKRTLYEDTYCGIQYFDTKAEHPGIFSLVERCNINSETKD